MKRLHKVRIEIHKLTEKIRSRVKRWRASTCRRRSKATFIAVTGSSLKSTTTKMLAHILSGAAPVRAQVQYNKLISCVHTLSTAADASYVICEIGTHGPGALEPMVRLLKPSIGIVTLVGLEHYSNFRTYDAVAREKASLIEGLPEGGLAILNHDDVRVASMASRTKARVVTFGESGGDYRITNIQAEAPGALRLSISHAGDHFDVATCLTGGHNSLAVAAAFCCAHQLGLPPSLIKERIATFKPLFGRCSFHRIEEGPHFILDTHKGPYYSFYIPISMMAQFRAPRKRIVVGQISDAGNTNPKYRDVYRASRLVADQVIFVGDNAHRSKATPEEIAEGRFIEKRSIKEATNFIRETAIPGEIILLKSAQNLHLERLFLDFRHRVRCWKQECGKKYHCLGCGQYRLPFRKHKKIKRESRKRSRMNWPEDRKAAAQGPDRTRNAKNPVRDCNHDSPRSRSRATFVGITGSSGKSSTTGMVSHILAGVAPVHRCFTNIQSLVPGCRWRVKNLTTISPAHRYVVCELGSWGPGTLQPMIELVRPSVGVVTLVGLEHYSAFRTLAAVAEEKQKLIEALPKNGLAILNHDDPRVLAMASRTQARVVTFGSSGGEYRIVRTEASLPGALTVTIAHNGETFEIQTQLSGAHSSLAVTAAFACAHQLGAPASLIMERLASFRPVFGRCSTHFIENGPVFIADTAKAPYHSIFLPINMMAEFSAPRRRIVVGQISDFAGNPNPKYRDVYRASRLVADQVIFVGDNAHRAKATAEDIATQKFVEKRTVAEAYEFVKETAIPDEIILLKSSRKLHLERIFLNFKNPQQSMLHADEPTHSPDSPVEDGAQCVGEPHIERSSTLEAAQES